MGLYAPRKNHRNSYYALGLRSLIAQGLTGQIIYLLINLTSREVRVSSKYNSLLSSFTSKFCSFFQTSHITDQQLFCTQILCLHECDQPTAHPT